MTALETNTSKLPTVEIIEAEQALARSTVEGIQSGLYFAALGAMNEIISRLRAEAFSNEPARIIGTGGFASLFHNSQIFDNEVPDLVLKGLYLALNLNENSGRKNHAAQYVEV